MKPWLGNQKTSDLVSNKTDPVQIPGDQDTHALTTLPNNILANDECLELLVVKERADRTDNTILIAPGCIFFFFFFLYHHDCTNICLNQIDYTYHHH